MVRSSFRLHLCGGGGVDEVDVVVVGIDVAGCLDC